ncbi:response regulator transcription factor [Paenibacillus sp. LHD-117]|uniref:winged helix-turn-helix transcriptional regulator n=1 Tax=Paenibacillus sp. LHD-117 TaxID=3071412 RepID=UPI0027DFBD1A|nr:response regulator transcription factor [Paenibacillus sp. LHD-117]MDQ6420153.1 response regulator transcription factor [Paenibacillus sp. LHD-117]
MREDQLITDFTEGVLCSLTKRVMLVSPLPDRVRSLLVTLSGDCFDVFSLHEFTGSLLPALQPELLVYDALPIANPGSGHTLQGGAELLQAANAHGVPVLVLLDREAYAGRGDAELAGAELLVWPSDPEEALARINQMLENRPSPSPVAAAASPVSEDTRSFKDIRIDFRRMTVARGGQRIDLTKTEYDLLLHFVTSDGSVLTRESLLEAVWGLQFYGGSNVVDVHIKSLRKKLKDSAVTPRYIVTVRGAGYRLADDLTR